MAKLCKVMTRYDKILQFMAKYGKLMQSYCMIWVMYVKILSKIELLCKVTAIIDQFMQNSGKIMQIKVEV